MAASTPKRTTRPSANLQTISKTASKTALKTTGRPSQRAKTQAKTTGAEKTKQPQTAQKASKQVKSTASAEPSQPGKKATRGERQVTLNKKPAATHSVKRSAKQATSTAEDRIEVRQSGVHGRGVFATAAIAAGERVIEYKGERISWKEALRRHPHDPNDPNHTFYFSLENGDAIDAKYDGNDARWINHACAPNCEAREKRGRVFIHAMRNIKAGEELFYDYGLVIEGRLTRKLKKDFACHCGAAECRGTMLAPRD